MRTKLLSLSTLILGLGVAPVGLAQQGAQEATKASCPSASQACSGSTATVARSVPAGADCQAEAGCQTRKAATVVARPIDEEAGAILSALGYIDGTEAREAAAPAPASPAPAAPAVERGFLGVSLEMSDGRVTVQNVYEKSAAAKAGLKTGDVLSIKGKDDFMAAMEGKQVGDVLRLQVERDGWVKKIEVTLGARPEGVLAPEARTEREAQPDARSEARQEAKRVLEKKLGLGESKERKAAKIKKKAGSRQEHAEHEHEHAEHEIEVEHGHGDGHFTIHPDINVEDGRIELKILGELDGLHGLAELHQIEGLHEGLQILHQLGEGGEHEIEVHVQAGGDLKGLEGLKKLEGLKGLKGLSKLEGLHGMRIELKGLDELAELGVDLGGLEALKELGIDLGDLEGGIKIGGLAILDGEEVHEHEHGDGKNVFVWKSGDGEGSDHEVRAHIEIHAEHGGEHGGEHELHWESADDDEHLVIEGDRAGLRQKIREALKGRLGNQLRGHVLFFDGDGHDADHDHGADHDHDADHDHGASHDHDADHDHDVRFGGSPMQQIEVLRREIEVLRREIEELRNLREELRELESPREPNRPNRERAGGFRIRRG